MANITELQANLLKMQQLLNAADNETKKKTFQDIVNNLSQQLEPSVLYSQSTRFSFIRSI